MPTMVQIGPEEMMQMQASFAAGIGLSHLWGEAVGGMEGQDTDVSHCCLDEISRVYSTSTLML